ncbi:MAG: hypothetical protein OEL86_14500 [Sulfuritalea sp.]|nr:hypothetical protein [Sulfuritalea sp.]
MSQVAMPEFRYDLGNSGIDADHSALAMILEALEQVCDESAGADCRCDVCPEKKTRSCHGLLKDLCGRMQALLLEHFQREHELMNSLPRSQTTKAHCERHRRAHVSFSTRYNLAAAKLNDCQPAIGARELESLVLDWIRGHALEFDAELSALLNRPVGDRQRRA